MTMDLVEKLFIETCSDLLVEEGGFETRGELGVFSSAAVVWLGIQQRLSGESLQMGLGKLIERARDEGGIFAYNPGRKLRTGNISLNTGGISRARSRLSGELVEKLFQQATEQIEKKESDSHPLIYLMDGQVMTVARSDSSVKEFGTTGNGEGELHYLRVRVVAAHSLSTGIASEIEFGSWTDSEIPLARKLIKRLPPKSILIMDRYFASPTLLKEAGELGIKVIVRLKDSVGKKLLGTKSSKECDDETITWYAKNSDTHSSIALNGRVIKFTSRVKGYRSQLFYFFTTLDLSLEEVANLYLRRVQVEVFIRQLKQTLKLFFIRAKIAENVRKEVYIAYLTFNLLRAIMTDVANATNCAIERLSFTATITLCNTYSRSLIKASTNAQRNNLLQQFRTNLIQAKLPKRSKIRSYPREVKLTRQKYPTAAIFKNTKTQKINMEGK